MSYDQGRPEPLIFNRIYITYNRNSGCNEDDFRERFAPFGEIAKVHLQMDKSTNQPKGMQGYLDYIMQTPPKPHTTISADLPITTYTYNTIAVETYTDIATYSP